MKLLLRLMLLISRIGVTICEIAFMAQKVALILLRGHPLVPENIFSLQAYLNHLMIISNFKN